MSRMLAARPWIVPAALLLLVVSCAGPDTLARRSSESLARGDVQKAYETARKALDKDPTHPAALAAMTDAARPLMADWKARIRNLAAVDTLGAARLSLKLDDFRRELDRYHVVLPRDRGFRRDERAIRRGGARADYAAGEEAFSGGRPKVAYHRFVEARDFAPRFRDVDARIAEAWERARTRVALLPLANQTDLPGLSRTIADATYEQVANRMNTKDFEFTELVPMQRVYQNLTVAEMDDLSREGAARVGRLIGAQRVLWGRLTGLRSEKDTHPLARAIYHRDFEKDAAGDSHERWKSVPFAGIVRSRTIHVRCDLELIDAETEATLGGDSREFEAHARTVYTAFVPRGDVDDYALVSPRMREEHPDQAESAEKAWKEAAGDWTLGKLLERSKRDDGSRRSYRRGYRDEFRHPGAPVFLDDLPSTEDLAFLALGDAWQPVRRLLLETDQQ